ncbi:MAG: D-sedoheptulose 7-phosphate isomerase [Candidatus Ratteibacteria bacterium]|nr:D-sedoheptulose 7-phosphate isomerase [Candidatus Ratteibacteria bacterium]
MDIDKYILSSLEKRRDSFKVLIEDNALIDKIRHLIMLICEAYRCHKKVLLFGNGGSAAQAQHFAAELIGRFKRERKALKAIALTTDTSVLTALGNDYGFEKIFSRQLEALVDKEDIAIGLSTSGNSPDVLEGIKTAKSSGAETIGFTGSKRNKLEEIVDINIAVPSQDTPEIQEFHLLIGHLVCELVEKNLFE